MPYFFASTSVANLSSFVASSSPSLPVPKSGKGRYKAGKANAKPPASAKTNRNGNSSHMSVVSAQAPFASTEFSSYPTQPPPSSSLPTSSYHKSRPTCTLSLAHAHVDAASFAHSSSSSSLPTLSVPPPNLPDRSELQSPIQEDRVHQAFRFPVVPARPVLGAGEDAPQQPQQYMPTPMSFRGNMMMGAMGAMNVNTGKGKKKGDTRRVSGFGGTNCIPFPTTSVAGPPSPTSSTTSYSSTTNSMNSYTRSATSSTTSVSSFESTSTITSACSSVASLELKLASFPAPPSTPPHVLLRVRQAQGQTTYHGQTQPRAIPVSPIAAAAAAKRARKVSGFPKSTKPKSSPNKPPTHTNANAKTTAPAPIQARSLLTLAAALNKASAPKLASSVSVPPLSSPKRGDVPRLTAARRGLVDDRDRDGMRMGMERPGSPVPRVRGERWRERQQSRRVVDDSESELDDAKQQQKIEEEETKNKNKKAQGEEDETQDLKSTLTFEPPPYSAPPPPYSPTASPPLPPSVVHGGSDIQQASRALPSPPAAAKGEVEVLEASVPIHAPVPKAAYVLPPPQQQSQSQPSSSSSSSSSVRSPPPLQQATTSTRRPTARVSVSEIRILLTLYRTLMVGLEKRYRAAEDLTVKAREEKMSGKEKEKEKAKERFPLVEEDDDDDETDPSSVFWVVDDTEEELEDEDVRSNNVNVNAEEEEEYIPRRRPPPTRVPPNSPVGSPPSSLGGYVRPSSSLSSSSSKHTQQPHHEPTPTQSQKNSTTAELDVQDALLAIRLRGLLKAQGVSEADLDVVLFDDDHDDVPAGESESQEEDDETMAVEIDRALAEMHAAAAASAAALETASKGTLVVVESDSLTPPMEEGMHALPPPPRPPRSVEKRPIRSSPSPPPPLVLKDHSKPSSPIGSRKLGVAGGGRTSPNPPPSAAYMIALLTMRHRYSSSKRSNGAGSSKGSYSSSLMGYPVWRRSSALKSVAWVAPLDEDVIEEEGGMGTIHEQQEEEEGDVESVVELYAGMC